MVINMEDVLRKLLFERNWEQNRICCVKEIVKVQSPMSYKDFLMKYMIPNIPCIFGSWITKRWPAMSDWVKDDNGIDISFLISKFGLSKVPVTDCKNQEYGSTSCMGMPFSDFMAYISLTEHPDAQEKCLYLKDWHCIREHSEYKFYDTPLHFHPDWLNEYWDNKNDDFRFVYIGPNGSWSSHHADVFRSYSWSANISGKKKWIINSYCFGSDARKCECPDTYEVIQERGEIIFIPSGWFHEVHNLESTISINHNWINAFNVDLCWDYLKNQLISVRKEICELSAEKDFYQLCQKILKADSGMDFYDFYEFIHFIATQRMVQYNFKHSTVGKRLGIIVLEHGSQCKLGSGIEKVSNQEYIQEDTILMHLIDLQKIVIVLQDFKEQFEGLEEIPCNKCVCQPVIFLNLLESFISIFSIQVLSETNNELN